jgi:hypothetical protein
MIEVIIACFLQDSFSSSATFGCRLNKSVYSHKVVLVLLGEFPCAKVIMTKMDLIAEVRTG